MINFCNGTNLAVLQDKLIDNYNKGLYPEDKTVKDLEQNLWVDIAAKYAPNNLVIRNYCLVDVFTQMPKHKDVIVKLLDQLSYKNYRPCVGARVFAEGYSYFNYTRAALDLWQNKFDNEEVYEIIGLIETGFVKTSYKRRDLWYPAPLGDLKDEPLKNQVEHDIVSCTVGPVSMFMINDYLRYSIYARPVGLNTHIDKSDIFYNVVDGKPMGFIFYKGYKKKYYDVWAEWYDIFCMKRLLSL